MDGNNNKLDKNVRAQGYCCTYAFIRMNVRPTDTLTVLVRKAGVSRACFTTNRAKVRTGEVKCKRRDQCLRALWLTEREKRAEAAEEANRDK